MDSYLISIAGNIAAGKSTLTKALENRSIYEDQTFTKNSNNYEYITDEDYRQYLSFFDDL
jgi:deoxyadenosine/deoxycytidine kinase